MLDKIKVRGPDGYVAQERSPVRNRLWIVVSATVVIYLAYNFYARRIDRDVIQADAKRATPATMYMDGVDSCPRRKTSSTATTSSRSPRPDRLSAPSRQRTSGAGSRVFCGSSSGSASSDGSAITPRSWS